MTATDLPLRSSAEPAMEGARTNAFSRIAKYTIGKLFLPGDIHMLLIPAALLMMTGVAFAMVGLSLERVLDPRLRER